MKYFSDEIRNEAKGVLYGAENIKINKKYKQPYVGKGIAAYLKSVGFYLTGGSSRVVWIGKDYVLKFGYNEQGKLDCKREVKMYQKAVKAGLGDMFAKCEFLGYYRKTIPVWIMEFVTINPYEIMDNSSYFIGAVKVPVEERHQYFKEHVYEPSVATWEAIYRNWGEDKTVKLNDFCNDNNINDLHDKNVGYVGNRLVLSDYAGYRIW